MAGLSGRTAWGRHAGMTGADGLKMMVAGEENKDFALALQGRLQASIDEQLTALHGAYWRAMDRVVTSGKGRLRDDIIAGGFHNAKALANTWRGKTYPSSKDSLEPSGWLYNRARLLIEVFDTGTVVTVRGNAQFLAIPLGPAKAIVRRLQAQKKKGLVGRNAFGRFTKDDSYVEQVAAAMAVKLRSIIAKDGQSGVIVADDNRTLTPTGRDAKNQARAATPLFALTKLATLHRRIKGRALLDEIMRNFPDDFVHAVMGELSEEQRAAE